MSRHVMVIAILIATDYVNPTRGQASATNLVVELENVVEYQVDTSDLSKLGTNPKIIPGQHRYGDGVTKP